MDTGHDWNSVMTALMLFAEPGYEGPVIIWHTPSVYSNVLFFFRMFIIITISHKKQLKLTRLIDFTEQRSSGVRNPEQLKASRHTVSSHLPTRSAGSDAEVLVLTPVCPVYWL